MFTRNNLRWLCLAASSLCGALGGALWAQSGPRLDAASAIRLILPSGSPLAMVSTDLGDSRVEARGGALVLDLHATLTLQNNSTQNVRGITLVVLAQEMTPGGKGSVAVPSLNVPPGRSFPVRINLRLLRPLPAPAGSLVQVGLDGVLFADYSFFGPNRLESRRTLTVWEMEARRDREYLKTVLKKSGSSGLQQEMLASLSRQAARPRLDVQISRGGSRTLSAAVNALTGHNVNFAFLKLPDAPLEPLAGAAQLSGADASSPRIEVANRSNRPVRYFELGWIVKDDAGEQFLAGSLPAPASLDLRPGQSAATQLDRSYKFSHPISGMSGFVSQVEFADGAIWIPSRKALSERSLLAILPVSAEEQRLSEIYRTKGVQALVEELGKFQ